MDDGISLKVTGDEVFHRFAQKITAPAARKSLLLDIAAYGKSSTLQRFIDQAGPDGTPWIQSGRAKAENGQTLRDSGRLYQSINAQSTDKAAEWGTNVIYAAAHQFGVTIVPKNAKSLAFRGINGKLVLVKKVTLPARPFMGVNDKDQKRIEGLAKKWAEAAAK